MPGEMDGDMTTLMFVAEAKQQSAHISTLLHN